MWCEALCERHDACLGVRDSFELGVCEDTRERLKDVNECEGL